MSKKNFWATVLSFHLVAACAVGAPDQPNLDLQKSSAAELSAKVMSGGYMLSPSGALITTMDINQDFIVDRDEFVMGVITLWQIANSNEDAEIDAIEFEQWAVLALGSNDTLPNRLSFDTDTSGDIDYDEFYAGLKREFASFDRNGDEAISRQELVVKIPRRPRRPPTSARPQMPSGGMRPPGGGMPPG